ncbi:hypothetical protein Taro_019323 [Colocasia esculenta]|uniref:Uncharacterized protein n=1 Tax=Colocasia esculenta TaxID=4460 RepID=A0A843UTH8_COLES|nr:hypothetical protein [Colocasia esculenta]
MLTLLGETSITLTYGGERKYDVADSFRGQNKRRTGRRPLKLYAENKSAKNPSLLMGGLGAFWQKDGEIEVHPFRGHWSLVILCHEEEDDLSFIILLDSLHSIDPTKLVRPIQRLDIYATKNKTVIADAMSSIDISVPSVND